MDLGAPWGNIARLAGVAALLGAVLAVVQQGHMRLPSLLHYGVLAFFLLESFSCFWALDPAMSFGKLRGFGQELMVVFLVWEFAENDQDLHRLFRAYLLGCWVLILLFLLARWNSDPATIVRVWAYGQDPNDAARTLAYGLPMAAYLSTEESARMGRLLAMFYLPACLTAVVLSGSRSGFVVVLLAMIVSGGRLAKHRQYGWTVTAAVCLSAAAAALLLVPTATLARLATIWEQFHRGDLNQRLLIWDAGWRAFAGSPLLGHGAGSFVAASGMAPIDTAHNTLLSIAVSTGTCGVLCVSAIAAYLLHQCVSMRGALRPLMLTLMLVLLLSSLTATVEENRTTWLLAGLVVLAARLDSEHRAEACPRARSERNTFGLGQSEA